ncbi:zinc-binding alcohol dehydrogenase [Phyllobacterium sp. YR531]|uniref:zinc-dependent alcohol dehydrogenase n=1 Tax=Phyllobacterium sp. YR531 TaxID=1144343 RepID=UPI00026FA18A|nr:zinc-binding alcohol dehydrogenase [Phyllobacterium sp. YR531]EJN02233.1 theronine dehydrogenase-like Zn-dependent dehydrogenase [Phyllobacterium sp. YR531]
MRTAKMPPFNSGKILIRAQYGSISRGTESLVFNGNVPQSEFETMACPHQEGTFAFPIKYGYSVVGNVQAGPQELLGCTAFCLHPHQTHFVVEATDLYVIPSAVPPERAVLAANMETALNIIWDASILPGDRVVVFGGGIVGLLTAYLATGIIGTETTLIDINTDRKNVAGHLGVAFGSVNDTPRNCDVVINASASAVALNQAFECAGYEGRIVEASWYGDKKVEISLGGRFHSKRLSIASSQVGKIAAGRSARWTSTRRLRTAISLLTDSRLDALFSGETPFDELDQQYGEILGSPSTLCHRIVY